MPVPPKVSGIGRFRLPFGVVGAHFLILLITAVNNDPLLNAAQAAALELLLTTDSRIRDRRNLAGRKIALVVLTGAAKWSRVGLHLERVAAVGGRGHEASRTLGAMEVHFTPEPEAQLAQIATNVGTGAERLVKDAALRARVKPDPEGWTTRDYVHYGRR